MWAMANNPEFVKALKNDKIGSGSAVYLKFFRTLFEVSPEIEPEDFNRCPLLFLQPERITSFHGLCLNHFMSHCLVKRKWLF